MTIDVLALMFIPFLIELLIFINISRSLTRISGTLSDLRFYFRDAFFDDKSKNYVQSRFDDIEYELHQLYRHISDGSLDVNVYKND